jgi:hypothetical protein
MYEHHHSDRKSFNHEHKKRKESDLIFNQSKKKLSKFPSDEKRKHRTSSSHVNKKSPKPEFDDARLFCDDCNKFYDNICPHHKQTYIPDNEVSFSCDVKYELMLIISDIKIISEIFPTKS